MSTITLPTSLDPNNIDNNLSSQLGMDYNIQNQTETDAFLGIVELFIDEQNNIFVDEDGSIFESLEGNYA